MEFKKAKDFDNSWRGHRVLFGPKIFLKKNYNSSFGFSTTQYLFCALRGVFSVSAAGGRLTLKGAAIGCR
jgi:hypothetical protein